MIFLSAQPDDYYFLWQLQLQVYNFRSLGVKPENIHILIGYNPKKGLNREFSEWITENEDAMFFVYPDTRLSKFYLSSVRPNIIAKHIITYPSLENETIFYHDSDIVFRCLPNFENLSGNSTWYTSDTRAYLDCNYVLRTAGKDVLINMCKLIGISIDKVIEQENNAGGAQYLIKKCPLSFWNKLESDSEKLYVLLEDYNAQLGIIDDNDSRVIQSWCADMWAFWWNALLLGKDFQIISELDFAWADSKIDIWYSKKILHYTGGISETEGSSFRKNDYAHCTPFNELFLSLDNNKAGYVLKNLISKYRDSRKHNKINLMDVTFVIVVNSNSDDYQENLYVISNYLNESFNSKLCIVTGSNLIKLDSSQILGEFQHLSMRNSLSVPDNGKFWNDAIEKITTPIIAFCDVNTVVPISLLETCAYKMRHESFESVNIIGEPTVVVDKLAKAMFSKILNTRFFSENIGKFVSNFHEKAANILFINKPVAIESIINGTLAVNKSNDSTSFKLDNFLKLNNAQVSGTIYQFAIN